MEMFWWITCCHQLTVEQGRVRCNYFKNMEYQLNIGSNEDVAAASFINLHGDNIE